MTNSEAIDAWATYLAHTSEIGFQCDVAECLADQARDAYDEAQERLQSGIEDRIASHELDDRFLAVDHAARILIARTRQFDRLQVVREQASRLEQRIGAGVLPL